MGVVPSQIVKDDGNAIAPSKVHVIVALCSSPERTSDLSHYHLGGLRDKCDSTQPTGTLSALPLSFEWVWDSYTRGPSCLVSSTCWNKHVCQIIPTINDRIPR